MSYSIEFFGHLCRDNQTLITKQLQHPSSRYNEHGFVCQAGYSSDTHSRKREANSRCRTVWHHYKDLHILHSNGNRGLFEPIDFNHHRSLRCCQTPSVVLHPYHKGNVTDRQTFGMDI